MGYSRFSTVLVIFLMTQLSVSAVADVVAYDWRLTPIMTAFDGVLLETLGINDKPSNEAVIDIVLGQEIEVRVTNELSEPSCLHWHGMKQLGTQEMDGMSGITQCVIEPNSTAVYRYTPDKAGTFWWHSHHKTQYSFGLRGPLIVRAPENELRAVEKEIDSEYIIQLTDIYHAQPPPGPVLWDTIAINNLGRFDCTAATINNLTECDPDQPLSSFGFQEGKKYLLRVTNMAAMAPFEFSIDGHDFQVIAADAEPVMPSQLINSITINIGQRYDIIVEAKKDTQEASSFWVRAKGLTGLPWIARTGDTGSAGFNDEGLAIIRYDSTSTAEPTSQPHEDTVTVGEFDFTPVSPVQLPSTPSDRSLVQFSINPAVGGIVSLDSGEYNPLVIPDEPPLLSIASGLSTSDLPATANARAIKYGDHIEVVLVNEMSEQHPFHLHSHVPWVVGSGYASIEQIQKNTLPPSKLQGAMVRDVYTVPGCNTDDDGLCVDVGYVVLRFTADNPGVKPNPKDPMSDEVSEESASSGGAHSDICLLQLKPRFSTLYPLYRPPKVPMGLLTSLALFLLAINQASAAIARYYWNITHFNSTAFDGVMTPGYGINNEPTELHPIEVTLGDEVEVHVTNQLTEQTCIHWHGMRQFGTQEMDGVSGITQCQIQPNVTAIYRFTPDKCGSFWFHGHEEVQYAFGLRGPLIVHCPYDQLQSWEKDIYKEYTVLIADWYHEVPVGAPIWDSVLINNVGRYNCTVAEAAGKECVAGQPLPRFQFVAGKKYLIRLINASAMSAFKVSIDGHSFQVIAVDGDQLQPSTTVNSVFLNVAQRADILVQAKTSPSQSQVSQRKTPLGSFWLRVNSLYGLPWTALPVDQMPEGFNPDALAIIDYQSGATADPTSSKWTTEVSIGEFDYKPLNPVVLPTVPDQRMVVEFTLAVLPANPDSFLGYMAIDQREFISLVIPEHPPLFTIAQGAATEDLPTSANAAKLKHNDHVEVVMVNETPDQHPIHLHAHSPWIVGSGHASRKAILDNNLTALRLNDPMQHDVFTVPECLTDNNGTCTDLGYVVFRLTADNPGVWIMHCHIDWHFVLGLAVLFVEAEDVLHELGLAEFSSNMLSVCNGAGNFTI
ncbi:hypothetical protein BBJ29_009020 [Phytophthora kernoviae]|uniref:Laccase n=1 Tax=Phytophthora kernoviae TaxID=325452 RepID=A0A3F2RCW5_9STRA|nr:hypothetical protein BBP00_00009359 [Phytophthora kernoviae]RLN57795.1 hypothetical protein BBJ29_009020 [Phytophthora kernoviae]